MNICIVGLGYVGLPLAIQFARSGATVVGLDVDSTKVDLINKGESYIRHIAPETIESEVRAKRLSASTDFASVRQADAVIICVPTPLNKNREPDISYIIETGRLMAPHLAKGALVVLESTTYPGTTDETPPPGVGGNSGLTAGRDFHLAFHRSEKTPAIRVASSRQFRSWSEATHLLAWPKLSPFIRWQSKAWFPYRPVALRRPRSSWRTSFEV